MCAGFLIVLPQALLNRPTLMFFARRSGTASRREGLMASTDNFAFLLPVMMLTFGCTFLLVARFGSREAHHGTAENLVIVFSFKQACQSISHGDLEYIDRNLLVYYDVLLGGLRWDGLLRHRTAVF